MTANDAQRGQLRALSEELDDATALWLAGREHLRSLRSDAHDAGVVLALLAAGAEKLLKLTLGLTVRDEFGSWPDVATMRSKWGHQISHLDDRVRELLLSRTHLSDARTFIEAVLARVAQDQVRAQLFTTLQSYAASGRFHNLDTLAGKTLTVPSPRQRWEELSTTLLTARPDLLAQFASVPEYDTGRRALNGLLDEALHWWQYALYRAWQHGLAGSEAERWSPLLSTPEPKSPMGGRGNGWSL